MFFFIIIILKKGLWSSSVFVRWKKETPQWRGVLLQFLDRFIVGICSFNFQGVFRKQESSFDTPICCYHNSHVCWLCMSENSYVTQNWFMWIIAVSTYYYWLLQWVLRSGPCNNFCKLHTFVCELSFSNPHLLWHNNICFLHIYLLLFRRLIL